MANISLYTHHHDGGITDAEPGAEEGDEQELAEEPQDDKVCVQVAVQRVRHLVLQPEEHVPEARVAQLHRVADGEDHHQDKDPGSTSVRSALEQRAQRAGEKGAEARPRAL